MFGYFKDNLVKTALLREVQNEADRQLALDQLEFRAQENLIYRICLFLSMSAYFEMFINLCIIANTGVLAADKFPENKDTASVLEYINLAFSVVFFFEMIIKMMGLGFREYFSDRFNAFDAFIVFISTVDILLSYSTFTDSEGSGAISAMRAFRLLRVFKLAKSWKQFQNLLITIGKTLKGVSFFSILLLLFIFTYSLLGMGVFAYKVKFNENDEYDMSENGSFPDSTFNNFWEAFISVFIVLANDGWSTIYFNHYRAEGPVFSTFFFISLLLVGQYILLNLFLAILLEKFDEDSINQTVQEEIDKRRKKISLKRWLWMKLKKACECIYKNDPPKELGANA